MAWRCLDAFADQPGQEVGGLIEGINGGRQADRSCQQQLTLRSRINSTEQGVNCKVSHCYKRHLLQPESHLMSSPQISHLLCLVSIIGLDGV